MGLKKMKEKIRKVRDVLLFSVLLMPLFTTEASAAYSRYSSRSGLGIVVTILIVIVFVIVKAVTGSDLTLPSRRTKRGGNHNFFNNKESFDDTYYTGMNELNLPDSHFDPRLSNSERLMLSQFEKEAKLRHTDPVSTVCPNCGAPLSISDKVKCPYCRSDIINKTVSDMMNKNNKPISPQDYNPTRYYDENITGYESQNTDNYRKQGGDNTYNNGYNGYYDDNYANRNYNGYYKGQSYNKDNNNDNRW